MGKKKNLQRSVDRAAKHQGSSANTTTAVAAPQSAISAQAKTQAAPKALNAPAQTSAAAGSSKKKKKAKKAAAPPATQSVSIAAKPQSLTSTQAKRMTHAATATSTAELSKKKKKAAASAVAQPEPIVEQQQQASSEDEARNSNSDQNEQLEAFSDDSQDSQQDEQFFDSQDDDDSSSEEMESSDEDICMDVNVMPQQQQQQQQQHQQNSAQDTNTKVGQKRKQPSQSTKQQQQQQQTKSKQSKKQQQHSYDEDDEMHNSEIDASSDTDNDSDATDTSELCVEFTLNDAKTDDFHTMKSLLAAYIPDDAFPLSALCDLITQQSYVGSMIRSEGTEEPLGFATVLSFSQFKDNAAMVYLTKHLLAKCPPAQREALKKKLASPRTALLLQHRLLNMPQSIVPPLHASLRDDLAWAITKESNLTLGTRQALNIDTFVLIARCFDESKQKHEPSDRSNDKKRIKADNSSKQQSMVFYRFEEELYAQRASLQFSYNVQTAKPSSQREQPLPLQDRVIVFDRAAFLATVSQLESMMQ